MKALIRPAESNGSGMQFQVDIYDNTNFLVTTVTPVLSTGIEITGVMTGKGIADYIVAQAILAAGNQGYTIATSDIYNFGATFSIAEITALSNSVSRSFSSPTRSLNSSFQISTTRDCLVNYSIDIATVVSLSGGAVGTVFLEYADNSAFTTNVVEAGRFVNGNTGTLVVGLTLNQTSTASLSGMIPVGKYARIRTANTTGTPTFTYRSGQEVLF